MFGIKLTISFKSFDPELVISCAPITEIAMGTSCLLSALLVAVTITSSMPLNPIGCWSCAPALTPIDKVIGKIKNFDKIVSLLEFICIPSQRLIVLKYRFITKEYVTAKNL